jgi:hypothetical protein
VYLAGKLDGLGIDSEGREVVVEVKSRAGALHGKIKEYEKIQVLAYEFMLDAKSGWLVEDSAKGLSAHGVPWDDFEWRLVCDCLLDFVDLVKRLVDDEAERTTLLSHRTHALQAYLDKN